MKLKFFLISESYILRFYIINMDPTSLKIVSLKMWRELSFLSDISKDCVKKKCMFNFSEPTMECITLSWF